MPIQPGSYNPFSEQVLANLRKAIDLCDRCEPAAQEIHNAGFAFTDVLDRLQTCREACMKLLRIAGEVA